MDKLVTLYIGDFMCTDQYIPWKNPLSYVSGSIDMNVHVKVDFV